MFPYYIIMSSENQCIVCKKVGHEHIKCHFRCVECAKNGDFHSKSSCPNVKSKSKSKSNSSPSDPKVDQKSESCTVCGKLNHSTKKCKFACTKCATKGDYHSRNICPLTSTTSSVSITDSVTAPVTINTCGTHSNCSICRKPNHKEETCHFRCVSCAKNDIFHSKTVECP
jgi:hypothetical protein